MSLYQQLSKGRVLALFPQVIGVMDAMPSTNLKPENEDAVLESNRVYRTTYMFR